MMALTPREIEDAFWWAFLIGAVVSLMWWALRPDPGDPQASAAPTHDTTHTRIQARRQP